MRFPLVLVLVNLSSLAFGETPDADMLIQKMRTKEIRKELKARGLECTGCSEKHEFMKMLRENWDAPKTTVEEPAVTEDATTTDAAEKVCESA